MSSLLGLKLTDYNGGIFTVLTLIKINQKAGEDTERHLVVQNEGIYQKGCLFFLLKTRESLLLSIMLRSIDFT